MSVPPDMLCSSCVGIGTDHFENIQSTNWNSVRWKPPPPQKAGDAHIGWRTELRTMEVQFTDFENAAFTCFSVLLSRALLSFDLNLYIPISKVKAAFGVCWCDADVVLIYFECCWRDWFGRQNHQNMHTAHQRNAASKGKFWFRSHMAPPIDDDCTVQSGVPGSLHSAMCWGSLAPSPDDVECLLNSMRREPAVARCMPTSTRLRRCQSARFLVGRATTILGWCR